MVPAMDEALILSSSAVNELMTHFANLEHNETGAGATRDFDDDIPF